MLENELIASDHVDNVHLTSLIGLVDIVYYDEHSNSQMGISTSDLFYRCVSHITSQNPTYHLLFCRRCIAGNRVVVCTHSLPTNTILTSLPQGSRNNCTTRCKSSYHPKRDIQHYCPRPQCRRWFHTACMSPKKADYTLLEYNQPSQEQLLVNLVSARASGKLVNPTSKSSSVFPSAGGSSETEASERTMSPDPPQRPVWLARQLPQELKTIATSAITRGLKSGNGIVGNAYAVLQTRWMARRVVIDGGLLAPQDLVALSELSGLIGADDGISIVPLAYQCPGCGYPI